MPVIVMWKHFKLFRHYNSVSLWGKNLTPPLYKEPPARHMGGGRGERFEFSIKPIGMASALFEFTDLCSVLCWGNVLLKMLNTMTGVGD